jgi:hypothetical protein
MRSRIAKVVTGFPSDKILFAPQHRDRQDYCGDMPQISAVGRGGYLGIFFRGAVGACPS